MKERKSFVTDMVCTYLVAAELSKRNLIVTVTSGNARAVDLLVASPTGKAFSIQVKGHSSNRNYWLLSRDYKKFVDKNLYYVFVNLNEAEQEYYVLPSTLVASKGQREQSKTGAIWYWISRDVVKKYKSRWDFFKRS